MILNERWIVTAAHCLTSSIYSVILGDLVRGTEEKGEVRRMAIHFFQHPHYNPKTNENDVGLLELLQPITFNERIKPVCLASAPPTVGKMCFIAGWGRVREGWNLPPSLKLLEAAVPIVADEKCSGQDQGFKMELTQAF